MIIRDVTYKELNKYCWTEDNRLQGMSDKNNGAWYNYDATGERNLKLTGQTMHVNQNGQDYYTPIFDQQTLYANPLITINDKGYTKHYFEEGKRICSKIGSGGLIEVGNIIEGISQGIEEIRDLQREGVERAFDMCMQLYPYIKTNNLHKTVVKPYEGQINPEEPSFYYHSDHLGSASFLTDRDGKETQQLVYLPFGEDWVDMKYNTGQYDTPYKFNGKEKDEETGYNNFGARYYYDWATIWLSVDPMSDKYPHLTSYNYCANNPVMLIDPDGREIDPASQEEWNTQKEVINNKREELSKSNSFIDKFRAFGLNRTLSTMDKMENSKTLYTLNKVEGNEGRTYGDNDNIIIDFCNTSNFIHEVTHAGQFEQGDIGFFKSKNTLALIDYWDEFEAYGAQSNFDFNSLPNKKSNNSILSIEWLLEIKNNKKQPMYSGHGKYPFNSNSNQQAIEKAFPNMKWDFGGKTVKEVLSTQVNFK